MTGEFIYGQTEFRHLKTMNEFSKGQWTQTSNRLSTPFLAITEALLQKDHSFLEIAWSLAPAKTYTVHRFSFILISVTDGNRYIYQNFTWFSCFLLYHVYVYLNNPSWKNTVI